MQASTSACLDLVDGFGLKLQTARDLLDRVGRDQLRVAAHRDHHLELVVRSAAAVARPQLSCRVAP